MDAIPANLLPEDHAAASLVGRVWNPDVAGPSLVCIRDGEAIDITSADAPTMRDLLERDDPAEFVRDCSGVSLGTVEDIADNSVNHRGDTGRLHLLAPVDLQAVKACGVTFAQSIIERVIEEKAKGDASQAEAIRARCVDILGSSLTSVKAGSPEAREVKQALMRMQATASKAVHDLTDEANVVEQLVKLVARAQKMFATLQAAEEAAMGEAQVADVV